MKPLELKPHQIEAVKNLGNGKILVGDVGSGKTLAAVAYYLEREAPRDIYVITTAQKRDLNDWVDEFIKLGVSPDDPLGTHHGVLHVDSWNNIGKYIDVENAFFIFDEQRLVGSGAWTKSFYKIAKRNRWIMLSATPGDTWLDYIPVMVANGYYKNRTEFKRRHVVYSPYSKFPKVLRYLESGVLVRRRNSIQVLMPFERHTTRHIHNVTVDYNQDLVREVMVKRWNVFKEEPMKDIADLFRVTRRIVNTDPSRLNTVRTLLQKHPRLIVFYNFDYELEQLRTLISEAGSESTQTSQTGSASDQSASSMTTAASHSSSASESSNSGRSTKQSIPSSTAKALSPSEMGSSNRCEECNPTNNEPCDPIVHGREAPWKNEKLSSLVSSSSPMGETNATVDYSAAPCTTDGTAPSSTHSSTTGSPQRSTTESVSTSDSDTGSSLHLPTSSSKDQFTSLGPLRKTTSRSTKTGSNESGDKQIQDTLGELRPTSQSPTTDQSSRMLTLAEWNGHKHDPVPTTDRWVYLVQYTAGAEGWNCITTDAMCFYSLPYSYKLWHQAHGRIDRLNTQYFDLHYYVLESKSWIDLAIRKSLRGKKSFNEASWGRKVA